MYGSRVKLSYNFALGSEMLMTLIDGAVSNTASMAVRCYEGNLTSTARAS